MADLYSIDEGAGVFWHPLPEFDSANEAETFAADNGHAGTAELRATFVSSATHQAQLLEQAQGEKLAELTVEGDRRSVLVNVAFVSVITGYSVSQAFTMGAQTSDGADWVAVADAWEAAVITIAGLPNAAAVIAYDVVTDPAWP